jgi:double-stranded uracil-DNA glycosylase
VPSFTRAQLEAFRGGTIPELISPNTRLLFVGFNPGLRSAAVQAPFAQRSNRFWPTLYRAGILDRDVNASNGLSDDDRAHLFDRGVGITSLVREATARADELTTAQLVAGAEALTERVESLPPGVVAILGITAYPRAFGRPVELPNPQAERIGPSTAWVLPNPSGLNAHATAATLAAAYREAAIAAGIEVFDPPR